jgi:ABC-type transport system substrate-binding protein
VEFSLITNAGNGARQAMAALIQADLSKSGIRVNIVTLDFGALVERISRTSQYEACLLGLTDMAVDPIDQMNVCSVPDPSTHGGHRRNPRTRNGRGASIDWFSRRHRNPRAIFA